MEASDDADDGERLAPVSGRAGGAESSCTIRNVNEPHDNDDEDFATRFAASAQTRPLRNGQTVDGTIVAIGPEVVLVDVGAKGEASIAE